MQERADASRGFEEASNPDSAKTESYFGYSSVEILYLLYRFSSAA